MPSSASLTIYPNPVRGNFLHIDSDEVLENVDIYDLKGNRVFSENHFFKFLDLNHFQKGLYLLKIKTRNQVKVEKILKL